MISSQEHNIIKQIPKPNCDSQKIMALNPKKKPHARAMRLVSRTNIQVISVLYISELRHIKIDMIVYKYLLVEHKILFGFATI